MQCHLHPTSALYGMGHTADYIVYHELVASHAAFAPAQPRRATQLACIGLQRRLFLKVVVGVVGVAVAGCRC